MKTALLKFTHNLKCLLFQQNGQDMVEYALVISLIAFGSVAGTKNLAKGLNTAFSSISTTLSTDM